MKAALGSCSLLLALVACGEGAEPNGTTPDAGAGGASSAAGSGTPGGGSANPQSGAATTGGTGTPGGGTNQTTGGSGNAGGTPSMSGGAGGSVPVIDGPPPPAITIDEYAIPNPSQPGWIAAGPDGNLWFTHQSTAPSAISKVAKEGMPVNRYNTSVTNTGPRGIAPGPDGNVWYTKQGGIGRMQPSGMTNEYGVPNGGDSAGIAKGPDGNLWFTQQLKNKISRVTPGAEFKEYPVPTANSGPLAITAGKDGNLWFTEHDAAKIGKITAQGEITEFYIPSRNTPGRIVAGPDGNLWFTLSGAANAIGRITPLGQVSEYAVPSKASDPYDIVVGPDMNLWFTELSANKVGRISKLTGGGTIMARAADSGGGGELGGDTMCSKDSDCKESGKACGGDVCGADKLCVLAVSADPGTCSADADCWCKGQGATCVTGHCSFTTPDAAP